MRRSGYNNLSLEVYNISNEPILAPGFRDFGSVNFRTGFPGGLYLDASVTIPGDILRSLTARGSHRVCIRNGQTMVYEGYIAGRVFRSAPSGQSLELPLIGAWGQIMMNRRMRWRWCDTRITDDIWEIYTAGTASEKATYDRNNRLRITPKAVSWSTNDYARLLYTALPLQVVRRISFSYNLTTTGSQQWGIRLVRTGGTAIWQVNRTSAGTSSGNVILSSPADFSETQQLGFDLVSNASQTPPSDGTCFAQITNLKVYSIVEDVNLTRVAINIRQLITDLSPTDHLIGSNTFTLEPWLYDTPAAVADILTDACNVGDNNFNRWYAQLLSTEHDPSGSQLPVLKVAQYPSTSDYDYVVSLDDANLVEPFEIEEDFSSIYNDIWVEYLDELGRVQYASFITVPLSGLIDGESIFKYGRREFLLSIGEASSTLAINTGKRFLQANKDPRYIVRAPIRVFGYIRGKNGPIPASEIQAGKRIRIASYTDDISEQALTFIINRTDYDDESETCSIYIGPPDDLVLPLFSHPKLPPADEKAASESSKQSKKTNWKRRLGLKPGTKDWEEALQFKGDSPARRAWIEEYKKRKKKGKP